MFSTNMQFSPAVLSQVSADLNKLPEQIRMRAIRPAVKAACEPIQRAYTAALRVHRTKGKATGNDGSSRPHLDEVVATKIWTMPGGKGFVGYVGARTGNARHAHLLEKGSYRTGVRYHKSGHSTGIMPAFHPLAIAQASSLQDAQFRLLDTLSSRIANLAQSAPTT